MNHIYSNGSGKGNCNLNLVKDFRLAYLDSKLIQSSFVYIFTVLASTEKKKKRTQMQTRM